MNFQLLIVISILTFSNIASANWLCRVAASQRQDDIINACGIAEASSEDEARKISGENAYRELDLICNRSIDCMNYELIINPLRTDCEKSKSGYKCYRGLEATITRTSKKKNRGESDYIVPVRKAVFQDDLLANQVRRTVVEFVTTPKGAQVFIDGVAVCKTPCSKEIHLGQRSVKFEKSNFDSIEESLLVNSETASISRVLQDQYGYFSIKDLPEEARLKINDMQVDGETIRLTPGKHLVTVEHEFYQPYSTEVEITKGQKTFSNYDASPLFGFVNVSGKDKKGNAVKARIYIDDEETSFVTPSKFKVPAGARKIEIISKDGSSSTIKKINPDTIYNLDFVVSHNNKRAVSGIRQEDNSSRKFHSNILKIQNQSCYSQSDCSKELTCATIRGEYPGTCVKGGWGF